MAPPRLLIPLTAAAALAAAPAAHAATIEPLLPCYRSVDESSRENVYVQAAGFTPGAAVDVLIDGAVVEPGVVADQYGAVVGNVSAPYQRRGERPFTLAVTERDRPENTAQVGSRVAPLSLRLKPREAKPSRRVRFLGRGFLDGTEIYGHYVRRDKLRRTVHLGQATGPCGRLNVKRRQIPVKRPGTGRWTLQVDNQPEYSREPPSVFVRLAITVRRVLAR